jgi:hypothetical protein
MKMSILRMLCGGFGSWITFATVGRFRKRT